MSVTFPDGLARIAIGKVRTSHGLQGEVKVLSYSGEFEHFEHLGSVSLVKANSIKVLEVEATRWAGVNLLLKFRGINQPEDAKLLADFEIWVTPEHAAPLAPGEVYLRDLIGCRVVFEGKHLGTITSYLEGGKTELLEVEKTGGGHAVLPFAERYVGALDLSERTVELKVDWILD